MSFDFITAAAVADQLRATLTPGRVQQIVQVDAASYALEVYAGRLRHQLLLSADLQAPRVHVMTDKPRRGVDKPSPLLELSRKFVRGSLLSAVSQPPWERVLWLHFDHPELGASALVAEMIGRWANLLLLRPIAAPAHAPDAFRILDCAHRRRPQEGVSRPALPGQLYLPPPTQEGLPPDQLTEPGLRRLLEDAPPDAPLWRILVEGLLGVSPWLAREVVQRASGDANLRAGQLDAATSLLLALTELLAPLQTGVWQPSLALDPAGKPTAFAPYRLAHRAGDRLEELPDISLAAERYFAGRSREGADPYAAARRQAAATVDRVQRALQRRRDALSRELRPPEEIDRLRTSGEWVLALSSTVQPRQTELRLPEELGLPPVALDPALNPAGNAARLFKRYRKARRAQEMAAPRLAEVEAELAFVEQLATDLALAADRSEIDAVRAQLAEAGYLRQPGPRVASQPHGPRRVVSREGFTILVGRNSRQNEQVTFELAAADDLWLHARDLPGAHVVIRNGGRPVSDETLQQAAGLAAWFSRGRGEAWVDVIVVPRRQVRRAPGGRPGMATVEGERTVRVRPTPPPDAST